MATEYVLVDFENVRLNKVSLLNGTALKVKVFLGASQSKIPLEVARTLQAFGPDAEYIQIDGNGNNALDFHIAFYIGRLAAEEPQARFHIVSADSGFDPLIRHVNQLGISCRRCESIPDVLKPASAVDAARDRLAAAIDNLVKRKAAKPRTLKTLRTSLVALFGNRLDDEEIERIIEQLAKCRVIKVVDGRIHYGLPA